MPRDEETDGCCMVAIPRGEQERQGYIVGGVLNLLFTFGIGTLVCAGITGRRSMMYIGLMQLLSTFFLFGAIWSFAYGILMLVASGRTDTRPRTMENAEQIAEPLV